MSIFTKTQASLPIIIVGMQQGYQNYYFPHGGIDRTKNPGSSGRQGRGYSNPMENMLQSPQPL